MINHKLKYIFVHVPRTGGHSGYEILGVSRQRKGLHAARRDYPESYYSFGFIRNPWDRMYSCWRRQREFERYQGKTFKWYLFEGVRGNDGASAMYLLKGCDFIGRYECLQRDWDIIMPRIGLEKRTLPHLNKYGCADYIKHYDNEMVDFIADKHAADIEFGGYRFG